MQKPCPFCTLANERIILEHPLAVVVRDPHPVSPGHSLVLPRRHVGTLRELTLDERMVLQDLIAQAQTGLDAELHPDAYNVGLNDGRAAGQSIPHLHWHVIPRFVGDKADARGGVRWILPEKAQYWKDSA